MSTRNGFSMFGDFTDETDPTLQTTTHVAEHLRELAVAKRIAFALSCAERLYPMFEAFAIDTASSDAALLRSALNDRWNDTLGPLAGERGDSDVVLALLRIGPRSDEHDSPFTFGAQLAVSAAVHAYQCGAANDIDEALWCSRVARDCIQEYLDWTSIPYTQNGFPPAPSTARWRWSNHPLFIAEVRKQFDDISVLRANALSERVVFELRNAGALGIQPLRRQLIGRRT